MSRGLTDPLTMLNIPAMEKTPRLGQPAPAVERDHDRDRKMAALRADDWSLAKIGRAFGISRARVSQILQRYDAEQAER